MSNGRCAAQVLQVCQIRPVMGGPRTIVSTLDIMQTEAASRTVCCAICDVMFKVIKSQISA